MSVMTDVADAIVAELNAATLSQPVAAVRSYLPQYKLTEMQSLHVTVVPKGIVLANPDRSRSQADYSFDVAVQKKISTGANEELDVLTDLRAFSQTNGLEALAAQLEGTLRVALEESTRQLPAVAEHTLAQVGDASGNTDMCQPTAIPERIVVEFQDSVDVVVRRGEASE